MGTSISHPSPNNNNWRPVKIGYRNEKIPLERVIKEIWRASENQDKPISKEINSEIIFKCHQLIRQSTNARDALQSFRQELILSKQNSIVAEFAKRAIPAAYLSKDATKQWRSAFFSELTGYIVSRDASGYVGKEYRNKSVTELNSFKNEIRVETSRIIDSIKLEPKNIHEWKSFVETAINSSKSYRK